MKLKIKTSKENYIADYVSIINVMFNLSDIEQKVLVEFIKIYLDLPKDSSTWKRTFDSLSRKSVTETLAFKSRLNVDQYIKRIKSRGAIIEKKDSIEVHPYLIPNLEDNDVSFKLSI